MAKTILTSFQQKALRIFEKTSLSKKFYLSGGTALAEFYLHHRLSEDLDFFTQEEIDLKDLQKFINLLTKKIGIESVEFQQGFALNTFFLTGKEEKIKHKIDFGQYPFMPINPLRKERGILVESLYDIAVNKAQTIITRPRLRDFIDLYFIFQEKKDWNFTELVKKSFEKFEMKTDALQIGQNLLQVKTLADMPIMLKKIDMNKVQTFFLKEIKKMESEIWG